MKTWIKWTATALVLALIVAVALRTLSTRKAQREALSSQQAATKAHTAIELGPEDVIQVQMIELTQGLAISGPLKAAHSAFVKARVAGELQGLTLREGDVVKAGQVVARVDSTESLARLRQAQQQAEAARAQVDIAKRSFDNNRSLVEQGFISKTALESSSANLAAAEANHRAAQAGAEVANKSLVDTVLRAPISGYIAQRLAQSGERVAIDARIVEILDLSHLELEASLSANDSLQVRIGQTAELRVEGSVAALSATVSRINPNAVPGSRAVLVYLALEPHVSLRQGLFVQGQLHLGSMRALSLPLSAVRTDKPQPYVQIVQEGTVRHQTVEVIARGEAQGQTFAAVQGISDGTQVLSGTLGSVRAGTAVKTATGKGGN